jgi:hypothetical protein
MIYEARVCPRAFSVFRRRWGKNTFLPPRGIEILVLTHTLEGLRHAQPQYFRSL